MAHLRLTAVSSGSAETPVPGKRRPVFGSLDYIYVPAADVDGEASRYVRTLGAELVWKVRGMGTTVACLRVGEPGPAILLSGHLQGPGACASALSSAMPPSLLAVAGSMPTAEINLLHAMTLDCLLRLLKGDCVLLYLAFSPDRLRPRLSY